MYIRIHGLGYNNLFVFFFSPFHFTPVFFLPFAEENYDLNLCRHTVGSSRWIHVAVRSQLLNERENKFKAIFKIGQIIFFKLVMMLYKVNIQLECTLRLAALIETTQIVQVRRRKMLFIKKLLPFVNYANILS